jgi:protein ImuA
MFDTPAIPDRPPPGAVPLRDAPPPNGSPSSGPAANGLTLGRPGTAKPVSPAIAALRARIERIGQPPAAAGPHPHPIFPCLALGIATIDAALPGGGIRLDALHEAVSAGPDTEHAAAATLFAAGLLARLVGPVLWVMRQGDLFAPGLACVGLGPDRVVFVEAGKEVLPVAEEGLRHKGLAAVVAEPWGRISLTASRRLQLAAERSGVLALLVRRSQGFDDPALQEPSAAMTRWRVGMLPSPPLLGHAPDVPGLARPRWRLELLRCRGGEAGEWIVEACDAAGRLGLAADMAYGSQPPAVRRHG